MCGGVYEKKITSWLVYHHSDANSTPLGAMFLIIVKKCGMANEEICKIQEQTDYWGIKTILCYEWYKKHAMKK